jgi:hypothetical protein
MKASVLLNVLNHVPGDSEWDGGDLLKLPDGPVVSISESAKTMQPGESRLMPPVEPGTASVADMADNGRYVAPPQEDPPSIPI